MPFLPPNQQCQSTEDSINALQLIHGAIFCTLNAEHRAFWKDLANSAGEH